MNITSDQLFSSEEDRFLFYLIQYIKNKNLQPGVKLPSIRKLSTEMNISSSQIRSGFLKANSLGIITMIPRSGCFVSKFDFGSILNILTIIYTSFYLNENNTHPLIEIYDLKTILEIGATKTAVSRCTPEELLVIKGCVDKIKTVSNVEEMIAQDEEFHNTIALYSRNSLVLSLTTLIQQLIRKSRLEDSEYFSALEQVITDHETIYNAIKDKNQELAISLAEVHSDRKKNRLMKK